MNYLNPNEISFAADDALITIPEHEAGSPAYNHPRVRVESVGERLHDYDRAFGSVALDLFAADGTDTLDGIAA